MLGFVHRWITAGNVRSIGPAHSAFLSCRAELDFRRYREDRLILDRISTSVAASQVSIDGWSKVEKGEVKRFI